MDITHRITEIGHYGDVHHPRWLDLLRISLGIAIFIKGVFFVNNSQALLDIMYNSSISGWAFIVEHHVAFTYLVGGILISIGLLTRIAIIFELPVFFGSIFCFIAKTGFFSVFSDFIFSIIVFILLIFFLVFGPGPISADAAMKARKDENRE
jgi:putative oxidoreductase